MCMTRYVRIKSLVRYTDAIQTFFKIFRIDYTYRRRHCRHIKSTDIDFSFIIYFRYTTRAKEYIRDKVIFKILLHSYFVPVV
jgi:hypothetical protein